MSSSRAIATVERLGAGVVLADTATGTYVASERVVTDHALVNLFAEGDGRAGADLFGWHIDPSVNCWANDLPPEQRIELGASLPVSWDGWQLLYVPGRFLDVRRGRGRRTLYDLSTFWPGRRDELADVAAEWGFNPPPIVGAGDRARAFEFDGWNQTMLADYATARARLIGQLADALFAALAAHKLLPSRPYGVGAIGSLVLRSHRDGSWVSRYRPDRQPVIDDTPMLPLFLSAYYGGRIETTLLGALDAPLWRLDMRAAYAWAMSWVGAVGWRWEHATTWRPSLVDRMSIWRVEWHTPQQWLGPLPWRDQRVERGMLFPTVGSGWYWWPEVRAALAVHGPRAVRVHEGYVSPGSSLRPMLQPMAELYRLRRELESTGDPLAGVVKGSGNAAYGKLAQSVGMAGEPGRLYNPALAGWVCSAVRARLLLAIGATDSHVAALMTDGYITDREPAPALLSANLGGWRADRFERAELYAPGIYRLWRADGSYETAQAGVQRELDYDWLAGELTAHGTARVTGRWFVPHLLADFHPFSRRFAHQRCRWIESSSLIDPNVVVRRRLGAMSLRDPMDWTTEVRAVGPWQTAGDHLSHPYPGPPAWSLGGFDPIHYAAAHALGG